MKDHIDRRRTTVAGMKPGHGEQTEVLELTVRELERARVLVLELAGGAVSTVASELAKTVEENACQACVTGLERE